MQKARLLTDEKSVSFQLFLRLLSSITLCSENQIPVFTAILKSLFLFCLFVRRKKPKFGDSRFFSDKTTS